MVVVTLTDGATCGVGVGVGVDGSGVKVGAGVAGGGVEVEVRIERGVGSGVAAATSRDVEAGAGADVSEGAADADADGAALGVEASVEAGDPAVDHGVAVPPGTGVLLASTVRAADPGPSTAAVTFGGVEPKRDQEVTAMAMARRSPSNAQARRRRRRAAATAGEGDGPELARASAGSEQSDSDSQLPTVGSSIAFGAVWPACTLQTKRTGADYALNPGSRGRTSSHTF